MKMIEVKSYRDLTVWQKSMDLVVRCYSIAIHFIFTNISLGKRDTSTQALINAVSLKFSITVRLTHFFSSVNRLQ
jgi:hypothetical protein